MASKRRKMDIRFGPILKSNCNMLRTLNKAVFPVSYTEQFYDGAPKLPRDFTMYAWCGEFVVGGICCREDAHEGEDEASRSKKLYIMTLGVLAAWRGRGIGSMLLQEVLDKAAERDDLDHIYLHVQTSNDTAISFYDRHGFENVGMIPNYYKRIEPPDCFILRKSLSGAKVSEAPATENGIFEEDGAVQ